MSSELDPKASPETDPEGQPSEEPKGQPETEPKAGTEEPGTKTAAPDVDRIRQDYEHLQRKLAEQGEELGSLRNFRHQYEEAVRRQQAATDPIETASNEMAEAIQSFDPGRIAAAQKHYAAAVRESARKEAEAYSMQYGAAFLKSLEGRDAAREWGVNEAQMTETLKKVRAGSPDMVALARLSALEAGTYDAAIQKRKEQQDRESRLAALAGSQADGRAKGPGRLGNGPGKARFQELRVIPHLRHDLRPQDDRAAKFIKDYMNGVDPESVPQEMRHLIG